MENRCVCCGEIIPEGRWTCPKCVERSEERRRKMTYKYPCDACEFNEGCSKWRSCKGWKTWFNTNWRMIRELIGGIKWEGDEDYD